MQATGLQMLIESWGGETIAALSLKEAEERLAELQRGPDVAVVDFRLGDGVSGVDAVERLREVAGHRFPAVVQTGDTDPEVAETARAHGLQLLHKPYTSERMREALETALLGARDQD